ncbi:MAG TPA: ATP-binding protein [Niabella sp.]|nr:ATP-binding protein [Niabella sp.]
MSDWNQEIESRLVKSKIYSILRAKSLAESESVDSQVSSMVYTCVKYAYDKAKMIIKYMPEYTLHDAEHLFRVLYLMEKLIPEENLNKLSVPELMLLVLSAFFHDLGMSPEESEVKAWKRQWLANEPDSIELSNYSKFERFKSLYPEKLDEIDRLRMNGEYSKADLIEQHLISEYIRINHAKRVKELIAKDWKGKIKYQESELTKTLADICYSHNEDALKLLNLDSSYLCGEGAMVCIPFIGLILRLADLLDFDAKRTPEVLFSHLFVRNAISLAEWKKHRSIKAWRINQEEISFSAECGHPAIEASIRKFCDYIDDELKNFSVIISKLFEEKSIPDFSPFNIKLPVKVDRRRIAAEKDIATGEPLYEYWDTSFELNKNQVIDLLMGNQLYANREVALRELIQNSIDACLLSDALHKSWNAPYNPQITVKYYSKDKQDYLEINDNGIGMDKEIINNYYSKVGSSFYKSKTFYDLKANSNLEFTPISRFGIGILSVFMVADSIEVETKRLKGQYEYDAPLKIIVEGYDSIFTILKSVKSEPGTSTKLILSKNHPWRLLTSDEIIDTVKTAIPNPQVPLKIITSTGEVTFTLNDFLNRSAKELKKHYWRLDDNIRQVEFDFNESGFIGNAVVGIVEQDGVPVDSVDIHSNEVEINGENYNLSLEIRWSQNEIEKNGDSIEIDDSGNIRSDSHSQTMAKSNALFSIHGIHYAGGLFPEYSFNRKKTSLWVAFPNSFDT